MMYPFEIGKLYRFIGGGSTLWETIDSWAHATEELWETNFHIEPGMIFLMLDMKWDGPLSIWINVLVEGRVGWIMPGPEDLEEVKE